MEFHMFSSSNILKFISFYSMFFTVRLLDTNTPKMYIQMQIFKRFRIQPTTST